MFSVIGEAQVGALSGFEAFKCRSIIQAAGGCIAFVTIVIGVFFWGFPGAVWGMAISQGAIAGLNWYGIIKTSRAAGVHVSFRFSGNELRMLRDFSLPTILGASVYIPVIWVANAMLAHQRLGFAEMGLFSAADRCRTAILFLPTLMGGVALPMLLNLLAQNDMRKFRKVLWVNVLISVGCAAATAVPIMPLASFIMSSYGADFEVGRHVLVGLCVSAVLSASCWILGQAIISQGRMWHMFGINLIWAVVLLGTFWCLRERGAMGLVISYQAADICRLLAVIAVTNRLLSILSRRSEFVISNNDTA
jgi:O-antigen/teichoic acid export membrane protein